MEDTLSEIYKEHQRLLEVSAGADKVSIIPEIKQFIELIAMTGAVTPDPHQRSHLRALMRFWGSFVYDRTGEFPEISLLPPTIDLEQSQMVKRPEAVPEPPGRPGRLWPQTIKVGSRLGVYDILDEIGEGGFSKVYRALDTQSSKVVALKIIDIELGTVVDRFRQEFLSREQLIRELAHPHIIPIYAVGEYESIFYISMKYIESGSLHNRIYEWYWAPRVREILQIVLQTLEGLEYLHAQGVVHRDLKPANILLDFDNTVYLTDFGIPQVMESAFSSMIVGTPEYLSPEAILHPEQVDGSADIYSLGVILFLLLEGELPFNAESSTEVMYQHVNRDVPDLSDDWPEPLIGLVRACLAKDPNDRPTVPELRKQIENLLQILPEASLDSEVKSFAGSPESRKKEHPTEPLLAPFPPPPVAPPPPPSLAQDKKGMICPHCGAEQPAGSAFCNNCGATLPPLTQQERVSLASLKNIRGDTQVLEGIHHPVRERVLAILIAKDSNKYYVMNRDRVTVGRSPLNDIVIDNPTLSQQHALLTYSSDENQPPYFTIFDLASSNGILVNGKPCIKRRLKHNDVITFGEVELIFKRLDR